MAHGNNYVAMHATSTLRHGLFINFIYEYSSHGPYIDLFSVSQFTQFMLERLGIYFRYNIEQVTINTAI
jgi:hypothetical protein